MELFTFKTANKYFGIEARYVDRVLEEVDAAPVPLMPACHVGLIYYRGELFDVIDFGCLMRDLETETAKAPGFCPGRRTRKKNSRVILIKWNHKKLSLIPDSITGLIWIDTANPGQPVHTADGNPVEIISPDEIWNALSERTHGPN